VLRLNPASVDQRSADMWSFAILMWELATREVPYGNLTPMECGMKVFGCIVLYESNLGLGSY